MHPSKRILTLTEAVHRCVDERLLHRRIVLTSGCFDLVHSGHVEYVSRAAGFGFLILGINSDAFVRRLKGEGRPIRGQADRALVMASMYPVGAVVIFDDDYELIEAIRPDVYVASPTSHVRVYEDWRRLNLLRAIGAEVVELGSVQPEMSTSKIIEQVSSTEQAA